MPSSQSLQTARHRPHSTILSLLAVVAALAAVGGCGSPAEVAAGAPPRVASTTPRPSPSQPAHPSHPSRTSDERVRADAARPQGPNSGVLGVAHGRVPDGATVFDDRYPAVAHLDPDLLGALRTAATAARRTGVEFEVNSGWRSRAYQEQLLDEAVSTYGSRTAAARWVATPATSPHVSGDAVDIGNSDATAWLGEHGAEYGLCQIFRNEPWHFELRPHAVDRGCPVGYADPSHDPRMQQ